MNTYPAPTDYFKAVQFPAQAFTVESLRRATFAMDPLGLPTLAMGTSAVVFHATVDESPRAVRCFIRNDVSTQDRYGALGEYLANHELTPYVSATTWLDAAIQVNGATWPVLQMEWIDGLTLDMYINDLANGSNGDDIAMLADRWRKLISVLQEAEFAHGDLQHGNVLVDQEGQLRLVDFDGVWIPALAGKAAPTESGHRNYQHPLHHGFTAWGRWLDTFSALVIYLSLVALAKDPGLWQPLNNSTNLLFQQADFVPPFQTQAWNYLAALGDREVDQLARRLRECCDPGWVAGKSLEMTIDQPWWEKQDARHVTPGVPMAETGTAGPAAPGQSAPPLPLVPSGPPEPSGRLHRASPDSQPPSSDGHQGPGIGAASTQPTGVQPAGQSAGSASWWAQRAAQTPAHTPPAQAPNATRTNPSALALVLGLVITIVGIGVTFANGGGALLIIIGLVGVIWGVRGIRARGTGIKPPTQP
jgi:hypothetical protein